MHDSSLAPTDSTDERQPWEAPAIAPLAVSDETASGPFESTYEGGPTPIVGFYVFDPS